jgi:lipoprotein-anchoring transpeptidase ErfK/SrfK
MKLTVICIAISSVLLSASAMADLASDAQAFREKFERQVDVKFQTHPAPEAISAHQVAIASEAQIATLPSPEFIVVVDRAPEVQSLSIYLTDGKTSEYIGSARVSTGQPNRKEYFFTPTGLFENKSEFGNYRAQGTKNENGVRGLGSAGMRVFDFGWQGSNAGWGNHFPAKIRLQMHATDPDLLEQRLGKQASKGCVRVHHDVNRFIDENGVLDKNYDGGSWVLSKKKLANPYDGRFMLVLDSSNFKP